MTAIGFIGAGQIGGPMVERLVTAGRQVRMFARREEVRSRYAALGATVTDSVAEAVATSDVVLICVYDDEQLRAVTLGENGALAHMPDGSVLASHTTGLPRTLDEIAAAAGSAVEVIDACFSGTAADVRAGRLTIMLAGSDGTTSRLAPHLKTYASTIIRTGARGSALKTKLLNNLLFSANAQLTAQTLSLGERLGLDRATLLDALATGSGGSALVSRLRTAPDPGAMFARMTPYLAKDFAAARAMADALGIELGVVGETVERGPLRLDHTTTM